MKLTTHFHRSIGGKKIEDATEPLYITVTKRDVREAKQRDPTSCALARGIKHLPSIVSVRVGQKIALLEFEDRVVRYGLNPEDAEKIKAFDYAKYFKPDVYTLVPPKVKLGPATYRSGERSSGSGGRGEMVARRRPLRHAWRIK